MLKLSSAICLSLYLLTAGCATIVKSDRTPVNFTGGLADGETQISIPDGQYSIRNGQTTLLVSRSKSDIPISVTCNHETRNGIIKTSYDPLAGVAGNIIFGGIIGITIDAFGNKAYDPPAIYNLNSLCANAVSEPVQAEQSQATEISRVPSALQKGAN